MKSELKKIMALSTLTDEYSSPSEINVGGEYIESCILYITYIVGASETANQLNLRLTYHNDVISSIVTHSTISGTAFVVDEQLDMYSKDTLDNDAAVDKGAGNVGIPITAHPFTDGESIAISGTTNYDGTYTIVSQTANEIVITATYAAETFAGTEYAITTVAGCTARVKEVLDTEHTRVKVLSGFPSTTKKVLIGQTGGGEASISVFDEATGFSESSEQYLTNGVYVNAVDRTFDSTGLSTGVHTFRASLSTDDQIIAIQAKESGVSANYGKVMLEARIVRRA